MSEWIRRAAKSGLALTYYSGLYHLVRSVYGGCGVIFCLHRVVEPGLPILYPLTMIHADVLDDLLGTVRRLGWDIVSVDEAYRRLLGRTGARRFACFTFDDGWADNLSLALPVFRKHDAPLCAYIVTGMIDRSVFEWCGANHELVLLNDRIELPTANGPPGRVLPARTFSEKLAAFNTLDKFCRTQGSSVYPALRDIYRIHGIDPASILDRNALSLGQLREFAADPLVTIGAHTLTHQRLSQLSENEAWREIENGHRLLEQWVGVEVRHLAYPFGDSGACGPREFEMAMRAGFRTAVTTRQGNLFPEHRNHPCCLPRRWVPLSRFRARNVLFGVQTILSNEHRFQTA